ncbi:MAG: recombinase family protein [Anaerolineales bacterium]|nr:recombinase family protein [Anaerolineales bacterium]
MSKRAAIYARVSTDMQRDNFSIPSQVAECMKYVESKRYTLVGSQFVDAETGRDVPPETPNSLPVFVDDYTSRELSRPSLDASLYFLEQIGYDVLVVHALDRLARDPYIRQTLEREFNKRGAHVEYVLGAYEETPEGEIRKDLDATFAKWENAKRVERCMRGKKRKAESGKWVAGVIPFGYQADPGERGGLIIEPVAAAVIQRIFHLYTEENRSIREIARILTEEGHVPYHGRSVWAKTTINHILVNTAYIGNCYFNRRKRVGGKQIMKDKEEWIQIACPPIIDMPIFDKAQKRRKHNKEYVRKHPSRLYLLSGMIQCSECERSYLAQTAKANKQRRKNDAQSYRHRLKVGHCMNKTISARVLDPLVWDRVVGILEDPEALLEGYNRSLEQQRESLARKYSQIEILERALHKERVKRQNLNAAYLDPDINMSKTEYLDQKLQIDNEIQSIELDLLKMRADVEDVPEPASLEALQKFSSAVFEEIYAEEEVSLEKKRQLLEMMHVRVLLKPDGSFKLDGWFNVDDQDDEGLSGKPSKDYALQPQRLRALVLRVPVL